IESTFTKRTLTSSLISQKSNLLNSNYKMNITADKRIRTLIQLNTSKDFISILLRSFCCFPRKR
uniref:Uncharacterized protein n=1 Tax=Oryza brachyantha TaxID=4533 RepID=J3L9A7_ORYBR